MDSLIEFAKSYADYAIGYLSSPLNPSARLYFVYILISVFAAFFVFLRHQKRDSLNGNFLAFLFPKSVWKNPSAWLDLRYFFFHGLIGKFLMLGIGTSTFLAGINLTVGLEQYGDFSTISPHGPVLSFMIGALALIFVALSSDFIAFYIHYLQHKIPLLWQFHKVHHAGEVMHPLSNFREHPLDNLAYIAIVGFLSACLYGLLIKSLGYTPVAIRALGLAAVAVLLNLSAYHLRHSHIWLRWPGKWAMAYASPAHHHVHHSRHPDHLDKNFAFMFPIWDVLFGTYVMPEDNKDVEFGIVEDSSELDSCINLYFIPFRDAYRLLKRRKNPSKTPALEIET